MALLLNMELIAIPLEKLKKIEEELASIKKLIQASSKPHNTPTWLSKKETCARLKVCGKTLESYFVKRLLPYSVNGSKKYVLESDIQNFLMDRYIKKH